MRQALWLEQFFGIALGRTSVESLVYGALADGPTNAIPGSGLVDAQLAPKEAFRILMRLRESTQGGKGTPSRSGDA